MLKNQDQSHPVNKLSNSDATDDVPTNETNSKDKDKDKNKNQVIDKNNDNEKQQIDDQGTTESEVDKPNDKRKNTRHPVTSKRTSRHLQTQEDRLRVIETAELLGGDEEGSEEDENEAPGGKRKAPTPEERAPKRSKIAALEERMENMFQVILDKIESKIYRWSPVNQNQRDRLARRR
ncbi:MATH and LRR domain-containing protein PFE0570w-like [Microplitis mediator]|uniref:MATH and LRR domain-containing protein PFE0570w-like n=1 Tax=Microplitis mediator TaxID=375433 RepID=UPI002555BDAF|nr:MATH and LRR domain-containing protein PFE0570w-like [Microplitis mediator]